MKAIVLGATGLVGSEIVRQLLADEDVERVVTLVRRRSETSHVKLEEHVVNFDAPETFAGRVRGDALFSALGTTIGKAGSQAAQYLVDHTYQLRVAELAARNGVGSYVLVSAMGADPASRFFYPRMKGELERDVEALPFRKVAILRPGFLDGPRIEKRRGERFALAVLRPLPQWRFLAAVRPIQASVVARASIVVAREPQRGVHRYDAAQLFELGAGAG